MAKNNDGVNNNDNHNKGKVNKNQVLKICKLWRKLTVWTQGDKEQDDYLKLQERNDLYRILIALQIRA